MLLLKEIFFLLGCDLCLFFRIYSSIPTKHSPFLVDHHKVDHIYSTRTEETSSICLSVFDDNHFLFEWIIYHYFMINLRYLVITRNPRFQTTPHHILDRWRSERIIEYWNNGCFFQINTNQTLLEDHKVQQWCSPWMSPDTEANR